MAKVTEHADGKTRAEWRAQLEAEGLDEYEIRFIIAVAFGETDGDVVDELQEAT
jgi:hypothetical protein